MTEAVPPNSSLPTTHHPPTPTPLSNGDDTPSTSTNTTLRSLCATLHAQITAFLSEDVPTERLRDVQRQTRLSLAIIQSALDRYPLAALSLSYNGGKDCLVLLILYLSLLAHHPQLPPSLPAIYIPPSDPFASVTEFTLASAERYHLALDIHVADEGGGSANVKKAPAGGMKEAFASYLREHKEVEAIFVGTRRTDPHGGRLSGQGFDLTDGGWPRFMRVHPVIEWHYAEVWAFLRHLKIPYCELYDQGYTSLGGTNDTHPNPALRVEGPEGEEVRYRPAYELEEDREERLGRDW
ncbi:MAG: hypothetical protein LQ345_001623 [Seirophora villosa]|nr:MAG: hypothetical protein LQ345_001623 [Seirophora villosa]